MNKKVKRIEIIDFNDIKKSVSKKDFKLIKKVFCIVNKKNIITTKIQNELLNNSLVLAFRGFNSYSKDFYIYLDNKGKYNFSVGVANIKGAGRGFEFSLTYFKGEI